MSSEQNMGNMIENCLMLLSSQLSEDDTRELVNELLKVIDTNNDNRIDIRELKMFPGDFLRLWVVFNTDWSSLKDH
uniref:EF-hand domain-containing protein n=1 Tax=Schistosoma haematobium TaxID=6185 RepID=A0A094ZQC0_SCHHA